jgi:hypothetical protein
MNPCSRGGSALFVCFLETKQDVGGVFEKKKPAAMNGCTGGCLQNVRWPFIP